MSISLQLDPLLGEEQEERDEEARRRIGTNIHRQCRRGAKPKAAMRCAEVEH